MRGLIYTTLSNTLKMNQDLALLSRMSILADNIFKRFYAPLIASLCVYTFNLSHHCSLRAAQCIGGYWLDHWLIGYDLGFSRRGLLGWAHKLLVGESLNIQALHLFSYFLIALVFFFVYKSLREMVGVTTSKKLIALMFALPILSVFFETLSDPIHLCIGVYGVSCIFIAKSRIKWINAIVAISTVILTSLVHEASLFLIAPSFVMLATSGRHGIPRVKLAFIATFVIYFASLVIYFLLMPKDSFEGGEALKSGAVRAYNIFTGNVYTYSGSQSATFMDLLRGEYNLYFGSLKSFVRFILKPIGTGLVPISFLLLVSCLTKARQTAAILWRIWIFIGLSSFPLYVIAHDWGRFAIYNLIVLFISTLSLNISSIFSTPGRDARSHPDGKSNDYLVVAILALVIAFAAYPIHRGYRIDGLPLPGTLAVVTASIAFLVVKVGQNNFSKTLRVRSGP